MMSETDSPYILVPYAGRRPAAPAWFDAAIAHVPARSTFLSQGAAIELLTWGEVGRPGLLFLPGNGAHADWWSPIAPFFAARHRCAALSWSGMGRSDRRAGEYRIETFAQEARDAIAAAGLDEGPPPIVVAHSMGGMAALAAADRAPFGGIVLIDTPLGMAKARLDAVRAGAPKRHSAHRPFASLADGLARFRLSPPQSCPNDYLVDHVARSGLVRQDGQWVWHFDPKRLSIPDDGVQPPIDAVTCPIAYVYGERSALLAPETLATTVAALPPGTPVIAIPDAAHHVPLDQPIALIAALRALLACWPASGRERLEA